MAKFTDTRIFGPYASDAPDAHCAVDANGGSVTIVAMMSDDTEVAVDGATITVDSTFKVQVANGRFKVTPAGGAFYEWVV